MANPCTNIFYACSDNKENIEAILNFFNDNFSYYDCDLGDNSMDIMFESKWEFPELLMDNLFDSLPDQSDIYMRCLSVEYGTDYVTYWKCTGENGWFQIV